MFNSFLGSLANLVLFLIQSLGYPGITFVIALENIFPPIPSEVVLPLAGFLSTKGVFNPVGVIISSTVGSLIGAYVLYFLGSKSHIFGLKFDPI